MASKGSTSSNSDVPEGEGEGRRVGLIYDDRMCKHSNVDDDYHPENPDRIRAIWNKLDSSGITHRCIILHPREVDDRDIALVHSKNHINLIKNISTGKFGSRRRRIAAGFNSIYFNEGSSEAAYIAIGSVIEAADKVAKGELDSAFAIVRPPGHHAEEDEPMGFCLFNNVAVAASYLLNKKELGISKILIVDWDVHHGNGTQKMFWKDPRVLFFSVHRHEFGSFYPAGDDGSYDKTGEGPGAGYNINVPWENGRCGDADYLAVWEHVLLPVAKQFSPDMIIVSAGFDAAIGDPLGGCRVTPYGYSVMLNELMKIAGGKIIMALEGGYNLDSLANSVMACVEVLLDNQPILGSSGNCPFESTWRVIKEVRKELGVFWPILDETLPEELTRTAAYQVVISSSDSESEYDDGPHIAPVEVAVADIIQPFLDLKVYDNGQESVSSIASSWRSELSRVDVWYATYGSNMSISRFRCYLEGGQTEGMQKSCVGSVDKRQPKEILWKVFPHRLFFGRDHTITWGPGGVAFLQPERSNEDKTYMCLYKITLEQFNDVLLQENISNHDMSSPLFDLTVLQSIENHKYFLVEFAKRGWYRNVMYLGKENDLPILTMTCSLSDMDDFKSGKVPLCGPSKEYVDTIAKGLVQGKQLTEEEARDYIHEASTKAL